MPPRAVASFELGGPAFESCEAWGGQEMSGAGARPYDDSWFLAVVPAMRWWDKWHGGGVVCGVVCGVRLRTPDLLVII